MAAEYLRRYGMSAEGESRLINISHTRRPAQYAEPVIGRRFAPTRWLLPPTMLISSIALHRTIEVHQTRRPTTMTVHERSISASIDPVKLERLAEVAVKVGLQLKAGQDLLVTAPAAALPLLRKVAEYAYKAGAGLVTPILSDDAVTLSRYRFAPDDSFDRAAGWLYEGMAKAFDANSARLAIVGDNPMLLSGEDPAQGARASKANSIADQPRLHKIVNFDVNWTIIAYPNAAWAKLVFPGDEEDVAIAKLADAIFSASRVDNDDPISAWHKHNAALRSRTECVK